MAQITDYTDTYFLVSDFNGTFCAGKNSFVINPTNNVIPDTEIVVRAYDSTGNVMPVSRAAPQYAKYAEQTHAGYVYTCFTAAGTVSGVGRLEIGGMVVNVGDYTGSIAYYQGEAYPVNASTRLPLTQTPVATPFPQESAVLIKNILIDITQPTKSEVRFFDFPSVSVHSQIYPTPIFPYTSYKMATGSISAIAVAPKHNSVGDYDYQFDTPLYQLFLKAGTNFVSSMEGEKIRIKSPRIKKFTYTSLSNNEVIKENITLQTDFIANIKRVVNSNSILLDIPFSTVSEMVGISNEDSPYAKNNLVEIKGYTVNDDPLKQSVFHKKNFYTLSIDDGDFEIFYKDIDTELSLMPSGSKFLFDVECNSLRLLCGNLDSYKIYGKSLNSPETSTLLCEGKIEPDEHLVSTKFNNGVYNSPGNFYSQTYLSKYWLVNGSCTMSQDNSTLIDGARISHPANTDQSSYVIFKDNTSVGTRSTQYVDYSLGSNSYWYGDTNAFVNYGIFPSASYGGLSNIPILSGYAGSQENLISGSIHDSNPIKLRQHTLYRLSMRVRAAATNSSNSAMYVYFLSGPNKTKIGYIDNSYNFGANEVYSNTFFVSSTTFGTIILVPVSGEWSISALSIKPYQNVDYSIDSFAVKIPHKNFVTNELYEVEVELYDSAGALAYGKNSYTFKYNKVFSPLKKQIFIDPAGLNEQAGGGSIPDISSDTNFLYIKIFGTWYRTPIATSPQPGP